MRYSRRAFWKSGLIAGVGFGLPFATAARPASRLVEAQRIQSPRVEQFAVSLPIPPVLEPVRSDQTTDYYELTQREATREILPGLETTIWGYNGIFPGPTIDTHRGRTAVVTQRNELPVPVVVHLHGGVTPPESDGYPTDMIFPAGLKPEDIHGEITGTVDGISHVTKTYTYPNEQRAATLWYHDHRMDFTGPQVYMGLAGFYLIRDEIETTLPLPTGEKEIPLMIADRTFNDDGSLYYPSIDPSLTGKPGVLASTGLRMVSGVYGDTILVNGAPWPRLEVSNTKYRFRVLNASNARSYELALDPAPQDPSSSFIQIGSDGGLLSTPIPHESIVISQGERFDVIVDFSHYDIASEVTLINQRGDGKVGEIMRFDVESEETDETEIPTQLVPNHAFPEPSDATITRRFRFESGLLGGMSTINGEHFDPNRIDADPKFGETEVWEISGDPSHPFHIHLVHFKVISRDGGPPGPYDAGWKDTVFLEGGTVQVLARFAPYRGKYVFHCHNLEHEDMMMMANFEVT